MEHEIEFNFRDGLKAWRTILAACEKLIQDPAAIAEMQRRALERPAITLGPSIADFLADNGEAYFAPTTEGED